MIITSYKHVLQIPFSLWIGARVWRLKNKLFYIYCKWCGKGKPSHDVVDALRKDEVIDDEHLPTLSGTIWGINRWRKGLSYCMPIHNNGELEARAMRTASA